MRPLRNVLVACSILFKKQDMWKQCLNERFHILEIHILSFLIELAEKINILKRKSSDHETQTYSIKQIA